MGEEFHAIIKLVSGEEIFSFVTVDEDSDDPILVLQNPVIFKILNNGQGNFIKVRPWMELTEEDIFFIRLSKVITLTESKDEKLLSIYNHYINDTENNTSNYHNFDGSVRPNKSMGYISTVDDARKKLEELLKINKSKEV